MEANTLWNIICVNKGSSVFYETTLNDFPLEGVNQDQVHAINSFCEMDEMGFMITFKDDDRKAIRLMFKNASTLYRLQIFMNKRVEKITWSK